MIELQTVSYEYDVHGTAHAAIADLSLSISPGEFVTVLGANGSGKTTFTRLLNGLIRPTSGQVQVDGMSTDDSAMLWRIRSLVGMVFASPDSQLLASRVDHDVAFGMESLGVPADEMCAKVRQALEQVGLSGFEHRDPHSLSGGQKQRVTVAGCLALSPRYLVFDEATAMLDPVGRSEVMRAVKGLADAGIAVIFATHSLEIAALSQRILILSEGKLVADGPPSVILTDEAHMEQLGVSLPPVAALGRALKALGVPLPSLPLSSEQLIDALSGMN